MMLQQDTPDDYVIATGQIHSVREVLEIAFGHLKLNWQSYVKIDPRYYRPAEVDLLVGDSSKAREAIGWKPQTTFTQLIQGMVDADLEKLESGLIMPNLVEFTTVRY